MTLPLARRHALRHVVVRSLVGILFLVAGAGVWAGEDAIREYGPQTQSLEAHAGPQDGLELPPSAYPIEPVEQMAIRGRAHGFVKTTTGTISFRAWDLKLPGRMPLELGRVYDSAISAFLPPPPPGQQYEPRWDRDLGRNWIFGPSAALITVQTGLIMFAPNGDIIQWASQPDGTYEMAPEVASRYWKLEKVSPTIFVCTLRDGTTWRFDAYVITGVSYGLTKIEDPSGNYVELVYSAGYLKTVKNSDGAEIDIQRPMFDPNYPYVPFPTWRVVGLSDGTGRSVSFDYDSSGLLTSVTDVLGNTWTYAYGPDDKLVSASDPLGNEYLEVTYDALARVATWEADNGPWSFNPNAGTNETSVTDALGNTWHYDHHQQTGLTTRIEEPTGGVHQYFVNPANDVTVYTDPLGETTTWVYDTAHRITSVQPPGAGSAIGITYDTTSGAITSVTDRDGGTTQFARDSAGRLTGETDPEGGEWTASLGTNGDLLTLTMPLGNVPPASGHQWSFLLDTFGAVTSATDPLGRSFEIEYSTLGDISKIRRPNDIDTPTGEIVFAEWQYERDGYGRITKVIDPLASEWIKRYDTAGRLTEEETPEGRRVRYEYDAHSRLVAVHHLADNGSERTTAFGRDSAGRIISKQLPSSTVWTYGYDASGRQTSVTDPLGRAWTYTRDLAGRVSSIGYPGGRSVAIARDTSGRPTSKLYPDGSSDTFTYDTVGRMTMAARTAADWSGSLAWAYDLAGRPTTVTSTHDDGSGPVAHEVNYTYDANGNVTTESLGNPVLASRTYSYDAADRVTEVSSAEYDDWTVEYHPQSGLPIDVRSGVLSGGTISAPTAQETWIYDAAGRVSRHDWSGPGLDGGGISYAYDRDGYPTTDNDTISGIYRSYSWNRLGLMTWIQSIEGETTETTIAYDAAGYPTQTDTTVDAGDPETTTFLRDGAHRILRQVRGSEVRNFSWHDAPAEALDASTVVRRASNVEGAEAVEVHVDFDGRLTRVFSYSSSATNPTQVLDQRWAPLAGGRLLQRSDADSNATLQPRRVIHGADAWWGEMDAGSSFLSRRSPVRRPIADVPGRPIPGRFAPDAPEPSGPGRFSVSGSAGLTGLASVRDLARRLTAENIAASVSVTEVGAPRRGVIAFTDTWLGSAILNPRDLAGDDDRLAAAFEVKQHEAAQVVQPYDDPDCLSWTCDTSDGDAGYEAPAPAVITSCGDAVVGFSVRPGLSGPSAELPAAGPKCEILEVNCVDYPWLEFCESDPPGNPPGQCDWPDAFDYGEQSPPRQKYPSSGGVDLKNGEFVYAATDANGYTAAHPVTFERTYRSLAKDAGTVLGYNWHHNWAESVEYFPADANCDARVRWTDASGERHLFSESSRDAEYIRFFGPQGGFVRVIKEVAGNIQIRFPSGEIHHFPAGSGNLQSIESQGTTLDVNWISLTSTGSSPETRTVIESVSSQGQSILEFEYDTDGSRVLLESVTANGQTVTYGYNACDELATVELAPTDLGYALDGSPIATQAAPKTAYVYENPEGLDCRTALPDGHKLTEIRERQFNPLIDSAPVEDVPVLINRYHSSELAAADSSYMKVVGQCFPPIGSCQPGAEDLRYAYSGSDHAVSDVVLTDARVTSADGSAREDVYDFSDQLFPYGGGMSRTLDRNGIAAKWYEEFEGGVQTRVRNPDGSCRESAYVEVGGVQLLERARIVPRGSCSTTAGYSIYGLLTMYTYEPFNGKRRTVTGPAAFQSGIPPVDFDPLVSPWRRYTTEYSFDFDQVPATGPARDAMEAYCEKWSLECPGPGSDLNGDQADDDEYYGNTVRTRQVHSVSGDPGSEVYAYLDHLGRSQPSGRPIWSQVPSGVRLEYEYYTAISATDGSGNDTGAWDWRRSAALSTVGAGPLAQARTVATGGASIIETKVAYRNDGALLTTENATGENVQHRPDRFGNPLETLRCLAPSGATECAAGGLPDSSVLSATRVTRDLAGRVLRAAVLAGDDLSELQETWTTYDERGLPTSITIDPDAAAVPGGQAPPGSTDLHLRSLIYYDAGGRESKTVTPAGRQACYEYDSLGRRTKIVRYDQLESSPTASCATPGLDDVINETHHDIEGRVHAQRDGNGEWMYRWYDAYGRLQFVSPGRPSNALDPVLPPSGPTTAASASWWAERFYWPENGLLRSTAVYGSDGRGGSGYLSGDWIDYDHLGRTIHHDVAAFPQFVDADYLTTYYEDHQRSGHPNIARTSTGYDLVGRPATTTDPDGYVVTREYDAFDRVEFVNSPPDASSNEDRITTVYDDYGRVERVESLLYDPDGTSHPFVQSEMKYDAWGRIEQQTDGPGTVDRITTFTYDALGRTTVTRRHWDGNVANPSDNEHDQVSKTEYDDAGRVRSTSALKGWAGDPPTEEWATTSFEYDDDGLRTKMTDPNDHWTEWVYAEDVGAVTVGGLARLREMVYPQASGASQIVRNKSYDANGNLLELELLESSAVGAPARTWVMTYDSRGRLRSKAAGWSDLAATGHEFFGTTSQTFDYDDAGRMMRASDVSGPSGFNDENGTNVFDGRETIEIERFYDTAGRTTKELTRLPGYVDDFEYHVESSFTLAGRRTDLQYPAVTGMDRYDVTYLRDARGRLASITGPDSPTDGSSVPLTTLAEFRHVGAMEWDRAYRQSSATLHTTLEMHEPGTNGEVPMRDALGRLQGMRTLNTASGVVADFRYGFDRLGRRTYEQRRHEPTDTVAQLFRTRAHDHDQLGRLIAWREGSLDVAGIAVTNATPTGSITSATDAEDWSLDAVGNWTSRSRGETSPDTTTYEPNSLNQIVTITPSGSSPVSPTYDFVGQMRTDPAKGTENGYRYIWDAFGRLTQVWLESASGSSKISQYRYDALGRRVEKWTGTGLRSDDTTWFLYDDWRVIEERALVTTRDSEGVPISDTSPVRARYGHGPGIDDVIWMDRDVGPGTAPSLLGYPDGVIESRFFVHTDGLGSSAALSRVGTGGAVEIVERFTFDGYGRAEAWKGEDAGGGWVEASKAYADIAEPQSRFGLPFLFAGRRLDAETGLYYNRLRYQDPSHGRFLSRDPIGYGDGPNVYQYAGSRPHVLADPMGLSAYPRFTGPASRQWVSAHYQELDPASPYSQQSRKPTGDYSAKLSPRQDNLDRITSGDIFMMMQEIVRANEGSNPADRIDDRPETPAEPVACPLSPWVIVEILEMARREAARSGSDDESDEVPDLHLFFDGAGKANAGGNPEVESLRKEYGGVPFDERLFQWHKNGKKALAMVKEFLKDNPDGRVYVTGYSAGGSEAVWFVNKAAKDGILVNGLVTFDPHLSGCFVRKDFKIPDGIPALNFFQENGGFSGGRLIGSGARNIEADEVANVFGQQVDHNWIVYWARSNYASTISDYLGAAK